MPASASISIRPIPDATISSIRSRPLIAWSVIWPVPELVVTPMVATKHSPTVTEPTTNPFASFNSTLPVREATENTETLFETVSNVTLVSDRTPSVPAAIVPVINSVTAPVSDCIRMMLAPALIAPAIIRSPLVTQISTLPTVFIAAPIVSALLLLKTTFPEPVLTNVRESMVVLIASAFPIPVTLPMLRLMAVTFAALPASESSTAPVVVSER